MAIPGVKWTASKSDIVDAIVRNEGVITKIAKDLGVSHQTIYVYFAANPDVEAINTEMRNQFVSKMCDKAERTIDHLMSRTDDEPAVALKASQYVLNNQARKRGYTTHDAENVLKSVGILDNIKTFNIARENGDK